MAIFGLDVGEKRAGVATLDVETKIVKPVGVLAVENMAEIAKVVSDDAASGDDVLVVVGLPINQRGEETEQSAKVRGFAAQLKAMLPEAAKVTFFGESATTRLALERLRARGFDDVKLRQARAEGVVDTEAACIILEGWTEENL
jgi:putative Holliday junction resolvase